MLQIADILLAPPDDRYGHVVSLLGSLKCPTDRARLSSWSGLPVLSHKRRPLLKSCPISAGNSVGGHEAGRSHGVNGVPGKCIVSWSRRRLASAIQANLAGFLSGTTFSAVNQRTIWIHHKRALNNVFLTHYNKICQLTWRPKVLSTMMYNLHLFWNDARNCTSNTSSPLLANAAFSAPTKETTILPTKPPGTNRS